ncbi:hypothetical protein [Nonomuraea dietziae]|uniref:hypothetical protein n=1 Tax=Nonomuraea dietziae TaxID=65515 RepID=UPI00343F31B7
MNGWEVVLSVGLGLMVNEVCDVSPWAARKIVRWAAHQQHLDAERATVRAEELEALINERPGKLFKLTTALAFAVGAASIRIRQASWARIGHKIRSGASQRPAAMSVLRITLSFASTIGVTTVAQKTFGLDFGLDNETALMSSADLSILIGLSFVIILTAIRKWHTVKRRRSRGKSRA